MAKKTETTTPSKKRVYFEIDAGPGREVSVAGSFNDWDPTQKKLSDKKGTGVYTGFSLLEPGTYEYKFVVDGDWRLDENNQNFSANDFGTLNSVLVVE